MRKISALIHIVIFLSFSLLLPLALSLYLNNPLPAGCYLYDASAPESGSHGLDCTDFSLARQQEKDFTEDDFIDPKEAEEAFMGETVAPAPAPPASTAPAPTQPASTAPAPTPAPAPEPAPEPAPAPTPAPAPEPTPAGDSPGSSASTAAPSNQAGSSTSTGSLSQMEQELLRYINEARAASGLSALQSSSKLNEAARFKSNDMATNNYFSHQSPTYRDGLKGLLSRFGISYRMAAENIAYNTSGSAQDAHGSLMGSSGHRANILGSFTHVGVGVARSSDGRYYYTQLFVSN